MSAAEPVPFAAPEVTEADVEAVLGVLRSGWLTTGSEVQCLEAELSERLGGSEVVAVSSCTAALEIALAHRRLAPGSRVGVPAWTFASSALSAVRNRLQPVLLDVEPGTLNLSASALEAEASELDAVIPVHFGGVPVDAEVHAVAEAYGLAVVEDAAHALGAHDERGEVGSPGTSAACFSFYATKNLTSAEGGALVTGDEDLARFARVYRLHGMDADAWRRYRPGAKASYDVTEAGIKANMPDLLAALGRSQLARFDRTQRRRRDLMAKYRQLLDDIGVGLVPAEQVDGSADHLAVVELPARVDRDGVVEKMAAAGVSTSVHFRPLHQFSWFAENVEIGRTGLGVCDSMADRVLSLPFHVGLSDQQVETVVGNLDAAIESVRTAGRS